MATNVLRPAGRAWWTLPLLAGLLFTATPALAAPRVIQVVVALCDNVHQGIVPVPAKIGNGDDPANNLYWGCAYGVSTFFKRQKDWRLVGSFKDPAPGIYERLVFQRVGTEVYLVAEAYAGRLIKETTVDFLSYAAGRKKTILENVDGQGLNLPAGGAAQLIVYIGHNGLMDFTLDEYPQAADKLSREGAVFACMSRNYFAPGFAAAGAKPAMLTTNLMCPEAYSLHALANAWAAGVNAEATHLAVAQAYSRYQKCSLKAAKGLFTTSFPAEGTSQTAPLHKRALFALRGAWPGGAPTAEAAR